MSGQDWTAPGSESEPSRPAAAPPRPVGPPPGAPLRPFDSNMPLHPMTVSDIVDGAFRVLKGNLRTVITVGAVFIVPAGFLAAFLQRDLLGGAGFFGLLDDPSTATAAADASGSQNAATVVSLLAESLSLPFIAAGLARVVGAAYIGRDVSPRAALWAAARRWWALILAWILIHLLEVVGFVFLVLPGVAVMTLMVAAAPAIAVENLGPIAGMRRSFRLVRRRFWAVLAIALLSGLIGYMLRQAIVAVPSAVALIIGMSRGWFLLGIGNVAALLIAQSLLALISVLVYFDARIRSEGFDLQVMATLLARRDRAAP